MAEIHVLIILFFVGLISATFIPSQAEIVLFALLATEEYHPEVLVAIVSAGNITGTLGNYYLGFYIRRFEKKKWFPVKHKYLLKAERLFKRHGPATLLLSCLPFVGDPITITAGILRVKMWIFLPLVTISKTFRYVLVWAVFAGLF